MAENPQPYNDAQTGTSAFTVGAVLTATFSSLFGRFTYYTLAGLVSYLPLFLVLYWLFDSATDQEVEADFVQLGIGVLAAVIAAVVCGSILSAFAIYAVAMEANGFRPSVTQSLAAVVPRLGHVLLVSFLVGAAYVIGAMLFLVPGLIAITVLFVAVPAVLIDRESIVGSLSRSVYLSKGHRWSIFGLLVALYIGMVVVSAVIAAIVAAAAGPDSFLPSIVDLAVTVLFGMVYAIAAAHCFILLKQEKEGGDVSTLIDVFA